MVSKLSMSVHRGGGGVKEIVHVDLISPLEYFFPLMIFQKNNLDHKYPKNCEQKQFFLIIYRKKCFIKNFKRGGVSEKSTWLRRGVSQKSMLGPQGGRGGQKGLKNGPHGL